MILATIFVILLGIFIVGPVFLICAVVMKRSVEI